MTYVKHVRPFTVESNEATIRVSHPEKGPHDGLEPGEVIRVDWASPIPERNGFVELTKQEVDEILAAQIVDAVDPEPEPVEVEEAPVPGSGILPSPDSFVARRKSGDLTFFSARSEIKELTDGAVKGRTYDRLLENYAAWHMAVGQGLDG